MVYKCSIKNIEKAKEVEKNDKNLDFFIGEIEFLASGNIDDRLYISEDVLRKYANTVLGKFMTYKYSYVEDDVLSHEVDLQIGGYIPPNAEIKFTKDDNGRLVASTECVLSKIYCMELYDLFKDENYRSVSVEFSVDQDESGNAQAFNIHSVTILGKEVPPAVEGANLQIVKFSKAKASKFYNLSKTYEIKINTEKVLDDDWSEIDKTELRNKVLKAKNCEKILYKIYALVENGWKSAPSEKLKYPIMQIKDNVAYYNINALRSALKFAKGQNETEVVEKVEKLLQKYDDNGKETKVSDVNKKLETEVVMNEAKTFEEEFAEKLAKICGEKELDEEFAEKVKACGLEELAEMLFAQAENIKKLESDVDAKSKECEDYQMEKVAKDLEEFMADLKQKVSEKTFAELEEKAKDVKKLEEFDEFCKDAKIKAFEDISLAIEEKEEDDEEENKIIKCASLKTKVDKSSVSIWDRI